MSEAAMHRTGATSPLGKLTATIPATRVCESTYEILSREAAKVGLTLQEFQRELLDIRAHGLETIQKLHAQRASAVSGTHEESNRP